MSVKCYSAYYNRWRPHSGVRAYTEKHSDERIRPVGVVYEPAFKTAAQYAADQAAVAVDQVGVWREQGVEDFVFNAERCWRETLRGAEALLAAQATVEKVCGPRTIGGFYGAFRDDFAASLSPEKDSLGFNTIVAKKVAGSVGFVEVSVYPRKGKGGGAEVENESVVVPVLRRAWHQIQQARLLAPGVGVRLWCSDQCHHNGQGNPLVFIPAGEFGKTVRALVRLPGVTGLVHWSGYDELAPGGEGGGVPLTAEREACRKAFAREAVSGGR